MSRRIEITCDNCGTRECHNEHARRVTVTIDGEADEGMVELGLPCEFDLCAFCAARMRAGLKEARGVDQ